MTRAYTPPTFTGHLPPLPERTIGHVLRSNADQRPNRRALSDNSQILTHHQLLDRSMESAAALRTAGISRGDHVIVMLDNHLDAVLTWLGLALCGAVSVPVNTAFKGTFLDHLLTDSGASTIITEAHYTERFDQLSAASSSVPRIVRERDPLWVSRERLAEDCSPEQITSIFYTSGTTGPSKGVLVPHAQAYGYATPVFMGAASPDDISYVALPLFHVGGLLWGVYNALIAGGAAHVAELFSASRFWDEVRASQSTFAMLTGAMVSFLSAQPPAASDGTSGLRRVCLAPVPADVDDFCRRFAVTYCTGYGSTEASAPMVAPSGTSRSGSIGWLRPDFQACIVDDNDIEVADGDVGELLIRPTEPWTTFQGYIGREHTTVTAWRNLWFHTGDAMKRTPEGEYLLVDRLRDSIRRRGENVSSMEVEAAANAHPAVTESAAIGVPSQVSEEDVLLHVIPADRASFDSRELFCHLAENLPYFAVPRYIHLTDDFTRTGSNKIQKQPLRDAGLPPGCWDAEEHGIRATRRGITTWPTPLQKEST